MESFAYLIIFGLIYFAPTLIAYQRKRDNKNAILVINLFLGWTVIGWIVALAWSLAGSKNSTV